jgi:thioredoxin-related protein
MSPRFLPRLLLAVALALAAALSPAHEPLPAVRDLRTDSAEARRDRLPIVLYFYSRSCPYCREAEEHHLRPLLAANARAPRFVFRSVEIGAAGPLTDFAGQETTMREFSRRQGVRLVPHLRFVGPDGEILAPDLIGLTLRDFYGGYIEDAISRAGEKMLGNRSSVDSQ